jgi:hypothetical protein
MREELCAIPDFVYLVLVDDDVAFDEAFHEVISKNFREFTETLSQ